MKRCIAYVKAGGADFVGLNSIESRDQVKDGCARIPAPVSTIWGGPESAPTPEEYEKLGLRIVLYPVLATAGMQAAWQLFSDLLVMANSPERRVGIDSSACAYPG